jgi:hypothetical protein
MRNITMLARLLQIVNSTTSPISSSAASPSQTPSLSSTTFGSYSPLQTYTMSSFYISVSPMPSASGSPSASHRSSSSPSASITSSVTSSVSSSPKIVSTMPFYALTTEQWAYILVPCISFAVITWWYNIRLASRINELDHQLKLHQSLHTVNNPMNHHSVRNIIPGLPTPTGNKAGFSHV